MRKPLRPHREGPTIVGGGSEVILTVLYNEKESDLLGFYYTYGNNRIKGNPIMDNKKNFDI